LENALEAESESHVNRLSRELGALRIAHQQLQEQFAQVQAPPTSQTNGASTSSIHTNGHRHNASGGSSVVLDSPLVGLSSSPDTRLGYRAFMTSAGTSGPMGRAGMGIPGEPSAEMMLEAMRRENEELRNKLVKTEREYIRTSRLNELYREELIQHRRRVSS